MNTKNIERIRYLGRDATVLSNEIVRVVIDDLGGMMPEFSLKRGKGAINAHWIPDFRSNSGQSWDPRVHSSYWKGKVLYNIAGNFPCSPNFGPDCVVDGVSLPGHGWTANEQWVVASSGTLVEQNAAYVKYHLQSPDLAMPLTYEKCDVVLENHPAHYSIISIKNMGKAATSINIAHHNTVGAPFLQAGCRIYVSARGFITAPLHTEFDSTGRLVVGTQFDSLQRAPTRAGATVDLSLVPGMIGSTDFITGPIPKDTRTGWSCVVNPVLKLAYITFFPGPKGLPEGEIALSFNDLWMQYGGRDFTPWALNEGGADRTFCLGTENAVGAFANGLEYARAHPEILGAPTIVTIPSHGVRTLLYGTALIELEDALLDQPIIEVEAEEKALVIKTAKAYQSVRLDGSFSAIRSIERALM